MFLVCLLSLCLFFAFIFSLFVYHMLLFITTRATVVGIEIRVDSHDAVEYECTMESGSWA